MWILTGPFDAEDLSFQKSKLLKTGKSYSLGRKGQPLLVSSKKVSQHHCTFTVGVYTLDDVHDPDKQPGLEFVNGRDKGMRLMRGDTQVVCGPKSTIELQDGDVIFIVTGLPITVKWQSICCYSPNLRGKSNVSLDVCSKLGISVVYTPSSHITHHIIPTYVANASVAASLISAAQFIKLDWLSDILKNVDTLEETFVLPPISKHRPTFSPSLSPSQKVFRVWEPNEERLNMFAEYRFLVFGEKVREVEGDLRELIKRGGGYLETFDVAGGVAKLHKALTRGQAKEGQQLVAVADTKDVKAAVGQDEWKKLVAEVQSFGLRITSPETIVQSVLDIEPSLLTDPQPSPMDVDIQDSSTTSLPSYVPNSIPDEPSIPPDEPPPPRKRLLRRATSRQPSVEPTLEPPEIKSESPKPRRLLLSRRGKTVEPNDNGEALDKPSEPSVAVEPTPGRPRLKRRLGAATPGSATAETPVAQSQLPELASVIGEPPLKKFKALFDASDPSRPGTDSIDEDVLFSTGARTITSQTQSQTQGFVRRPAIGSSLTALREEEEESQSAGRTQRGTKRGLGAIQEEDREVDMVDVNGSGGGAEPARKRQALENVNHVERTTATDIPVTKSPKSSTAQKEKQPGAPVGKPDTDAEFLKAVASTKRGKRAEDMFDREFNNLKISKPRLGEVNEVGQREEEEEWRKFTDFGDDAGLRGNFMVVMEMSIFREKAGGEDGEGGTGQAGTWKEVPEQWKDKPNFKKFKKKSHTARGALVELVVSENNDYDAPAHWRGKPSQHTMSSPQMRIKTESQSTLARSTTKNSIIIDDESDENEPPRLGKRKATVATVPAKAKPPSRTSSRAPSARVGSKPPSRAGSTVPTKRTASKSSKQTLFLESDEDIEEVDDFQSESNSRGDDDEEEEEQTLRSSGAIKRPTASSSRPKRVASAATTNGPGRKAAAIIVDDDDSDDGAVFGGFGRGRRGR